MKKILFATTALIATASVAAAEVSFSGYGRFGLRYETDNDLQRDVFDESGQPVMEVVTNEVTGAPVLDPVTNEPLMQQVTETESKEFFLESRFRMNIDAAAETDGGVRFSTRVRMQADDNKDNTATTAGLNAARFSAEFEGLRIDVGNAAGALDNLPNYYGFEPGLSNFVGQYSGADYGFTGYSSTGGELQTLYARYAFQQFAVAGSYTDQANERWDLHFAYSGDTWGVAIGYGQNNIDEDIIVGTANFGLGGFDGVLFLGSETLNDTDVEGFFYGVSASYDVGAATSVNFSFGDGNGSLDTQAFGVGFIHDLGGGVSIRGGLGYSEIAGSDDGETLGDLGVRFNF